MTESVQIDLPANVTLADIEGIYAQIVEALDASNSIDINARSVNKIDTAGLQLLCLARRDIDSAMGSCHWLNPSESLLRAARLLGVTGKLGL